MGEEGSGEGIAEDAAAGEDDRGEDEGDRRRDQGDERDRLPRPRFRPGRRYVRDAFSGAQQRLDHFLFKMAPTGLQMEEIRNELQRIRYILESWLPRPGIPIKGTLFFCHGYGDTCTFFFEGIAKMIANEGYAVYAMDYPGFGLSDGLHGYIPNFDELVDHVIEQYTRIRATHALRGLPHFLLGQSMGGAVALKVHLKQTKEWDGVILVAPMCKISQDVTPSPPILKTLTILSYFLPQAKLFPSQDIGELAFRDPEKRKMADYNVISYSDKMRLKTAIELLKATKDVESQVEKVSSPLLVLHGAADKVTDPLVSKFLYDTACSQDKTMKIYEDGYHSILEGEPDDRISTVISDIISWLDSHCALV
ncbi:unnamed protein product [Spirodela intermedia]|uniref:Serine aminopeptidase S33 domain-containing protein n=1 Tax=Spirodela intermedia TaxID=51605 RepID=A0A7I8J5K0_SPIIN|nr:unnamed protein product [Spirodela intermedia]CAA6665339.1 unnamed protein product [Spirodela intermedia]